MAVDFSLLERFLNEQRIFYKKNESMKLYTSFKIGGICRFLAFPETFDKLRLLLEFCKHRRIKHFFLGNGTNILFSDDDYEGVAVGSKMLNKLKLLTSNAIYCESGVALIKLCRFALFNSLTGLEFAFGIPGSLGGAILMNAGAYGGEMKDVVDSVVCSDNEGNLQILRTDELEFSYRSSVFERKHMFILAAKIKCRQGNRNEIKIKMDDLMKRRVLKQPLNLPSAGSTFKRPSRGYASKLIEQCGLKSFCVGDAQVSDKHCGFIVNLGDASCADVLSLIEKVQNIVNERTGIRLEPEVKFIK